MGLEIYMELGEIMLYLKISSENVVYKKKNYLNNYFLLFSLVCTKFCNRFKTT